MHDVITQTALVLPGSDPIQDGGIIIIRAKGVTQVPGRLWSNQKGLYTKDDEKLVLGEVCSVNYYFQRQHSNNNTYSN